MFNPRCTLLFCPTAKQKEHTYDPYRKPQKTLY